MIWLTWRIHRPALISLSVIFLSLSTLFVLVADKLREISARGITCGIGSDACIGFAPYTTTWLEAPSSTLVFNTLPLLLGAFIGAPLIAKESEQGTYLFLWTQRMTRTRWLLSNTAILSVFVIIVAVLFGISYSEWHSASGNSPYLWTRFDLDVVTFTAYSLFGLTAGILAGAWCRRTLTAVAVTGALFAVTRFLIHALGRSHFMAPVTVPVEDPSSHLGFHVDSYRLGNQDVIAIQPPDRYWTFQLIESSVFLVLAALCLFLAWRLTLRKTT